MARKVGAGAAESWTAARWPVVKDQQIARLREWAKEKGFWIEREKLGQIERGRMEHDLIRAFGPDERIGKITRGIGVGRQPFCEEDLVSGMVSDWFTARPGTPLQYLERLTLVNQKLSPGINRLEGFAEVDERFVIVSTQPWSVGRNSADQEIATFFGRAGFIHICEGTWFREQDSLAIFDAGKSNLIFSEGTPIPIDVIPIIAKGAMLQKLLEAVVSRKK